MSYFSVFCIIKQKITKKLLKKRKFLEIKNFRKFISFICLKLLFKQKVTKKYFSHFHHTIWRTNNYKANALKERAAKISMPKICKSCKFLFFKFSELIPVLNTLFHKFRTYFQKLLFQNRFSFTYYYWRVLCVVYIIYYM